MRNVLFLSFVLMRSVFAIDEWDIVGKFNNFSCSLVENPNEKFLRMDHGEIKEVICTNLPGEELFNYRSENDLFKAHFINCKKDKSLFEFDSYQNIDFIFEKCGENFGTIHSLQKYQKRRMSITKIYLLRLWKILPLLLFLFLKKF